MKYFFYCRKSSESEDRQVISIESQYSELRRAFDGMAGVEIVHVYREAASAKAPGRKLFNEMLRRIDLGEASGIIAWHPDRLARNSIDGGQIIYLLDRGRLKDLKFATQSFENNPQGKFMLSITFGYSKYYVDSLSENVKRGNRTKVEMGWRPNQAPLGYRNEKETRTIVRDPIHFPIVRKMFELMLTGTYPPRKIARIARDEWAFRTPLKKRIGGTPVSIGYIYRIFKNPFYAGIIVWNGQSSPGKHEPLITLAEFDRVQELLHRSGRPRPQRHAFAFTGMIRCGACGLMVTAEHKVNRFGSQYTYYHCTKRRLQPRCRQPVIELKSLEAQIVQFLQELAIADKIHRVVISRLKSLEGHDGAQDAARKQSIAHAIDENAGELSELTGLRLRNLLSDDEFANKRQELQNDRLRLTQLLDRIDSEQARFEPLNDVMVFSKQAASWFMHGDAQCKRLILETVGSNLALRDKILSVEAKKPFRHWPTATGSSRLDAVIHDVRTSLRSMDYDEFRTLKANIKMIKEKFVRPRRTRTAKRAASKKKRAA